jgi:hypothetical protein
LSGLVIPGDVLVAQPDEPLRLLATLCVYGEFGMIVGEPGAGKSLYLFFVCQQVIAAGEKVLYITSDESLPGIRKRARRYGLGSPNFVLMHGSPFCFNDQKWVRAVAEYAKAGGFSLVVFDTIRGMVRGEEDSNDTMIVVATACKAIRDEVGCGVLLSHHTKKSDWSAAGGKPGLGSAAGGSALDALIEYLLAIIPKSREPFRAELWPPKQRANQDWQHYELSEASGGTIAVRALEPDKAGPMPLTREHHRLLALLEKNPGQNFSKRNLIRDMGLGDNTIGELLGDLRLRGLVEIDPGKPPRGGWRATTEAERSQTEHHRQQMDAAEADANVRELVGSRKPNLLMKASTP